jgi:uncharacterized membrane protein (DUF2068 family)
MKSSHDRVLRLIAIFKFLKAAVLILAGIGVFRLVHRNIGEVARHWIGMWGFAPGKHFIDVAVAKAANLKPEQIRNVGLGSFLYAGLFLAEGTGLWLQKQWGEWLTVTLTGSLIPVEVYEVYRRLTWVRVGALAINLAIVAYLIWRIRSRRIAGSS